MMNRKGVEDLPLRYLIIALVASIVIALALQMTDIIQGSVINPKDIVSESITGRIIESTLEETYITGFEVVSVFDWVVNSSDSLGEVKFSLLNSNNYDINITDVTARFSGVSVQKVFGDGLVLHEGESTESFSFNIPESVPINEGDKVSVSVFVGFDGGGSDSGSLVGLVK